VFDRIPSVEKRYAHPRPGRPSWEVWKPSRQPATFDAGSSVRLIAAEPFRLHWTRDAWAHVEDTEATATGLGLHYVDLPAGAPVGTTFEFTFFWSDRTAWEGTNHSIRAVERTPTADSSPRPTR